MNCILLTKVLLLIVQTLLLVWWNFSPFWFSRIKKGGITFQMGLVESEHVTNQPKPPCYEQYREEAKEYFEKRSTYRQNAGWILILVWLISQILSLFGANV